MRRLLAGLVALMVLTLLLVWTLKSSVKSSRFAVGPPLPPGKVAPQLVSTWDAAVLLAPDGSLWGWGGSQLGQGWLLPNPAGGIPGPRRIGSDSDWRKVSAGMTHGLALKGDGSIWGWGTGQYFRLRSTAAATTLTQIGVETNWTDISVGAAHSLALKRDGSLWAWGQNESGQVGDGTTSNKSQPVRISPQLGWKSIAAGGFNGYALNSNGTVWSWGLDAINGTRASQNILAPVQIDPGTNWSLISASDFVMMALKSDGTLWIRGQNAASYFTCYVTSATTNFTRIGADSDWQEVYPGQSDFFARKRDGSWWVCGGRPQAVGRKMFGLRYTGQVQRVPFDFEPWAFANGFGNSLLLTRDGTLWTWGERLGWKPTHQKLKSQINDLLQLLPGRWARFNIPPRLTDSQPYRLWELPADMRRTLGTNSVVADPAR